MSNKKRTIAALLALVTLAGFGEVKVIAFYPFKDAEPGTSLTSLADPAVTNAVDSSLYPGSVTKYGNGDIVFSDERPGKYLFNGCYYHDANEAYCTDPGSIYFSGSAGNTTDSCTLFFKDISTKLSEIGADGTPYVIEFYYKLDPDYTCTWANFFRWYGKWNLTDKTGADKGSATNCYVVMRAISDWKNVFSLYDNTGGSMNYSYTEGSGQTLKDGKWHHMMVNWPPAQGDTLNSVLLMVDKDAPTGGSCTRLSYHLNGGPLEESKPLELNTGRRFKGWISGLRILQLDKNDRSATSHFILNTLYASDLPTCVPRTISHLRFDDRGSGEELIVGSTVTNQAPTYGSSNPQLFINAKAVSSDSGNYRGNATVTRIEEKAAATGGDPACVSDSVKAAYVLEGTNRATAVANARSLSLPGAEGYRGETVAYGTGLTIPAAQHANLFCNYTYEMFFRFDRAKYEELKTQDGTGSGMVSLAWLDYGSTSRINTWSIALDVSDLDNPEIVFHPDSNPGALTRMAVPTATDGKWHHLALKHANQGSMTCVYDYKTSDSCTAGYGTMALCWNRSFFIGSGDKSAAFPGEIDEVRLSWGLLDSSEFLAQKKLGGLMLLFR